MKINRMFSPILKILFIVTPLVFSVLINPARVFAQAISCTEFVCDPHNALCGILCQIVPQLPTWIIGIGVLLAILFIVFYGIGYMTAGDDVKKLTTARGGLTWAVVGLTGLLLAFAIIRAVALLIGVDPSNIFVINNVAHCQC